jgi:hypothetical protein
MKKSLLLLVLVAFTSSGLFAEARKAAPAYKKMRYGMAGCGLGAMFIDKNTILPQIGAWFVNSISASQTFGITTGTSNCVDKEKASAKLEQEVFVKVNLAKLSREAAEGSGEHLDALAEVLGCEGNSFAKLSQDRYSKIFGNEDAKTVLENYAKEIQSSELSESCSRIVG